MTVAVSLPAYAKIRLQADDGQAQALMVVCLLQPVLDCIPVECDPTKIDHGIALPLMCDDGRADAIVEVLRQRVRPSQLQLWRKSKSGWRSV